MSFYTLETIRDETSGRTTVRGSLAVDDVPGCELAVLAYLEEFGYSPSTGVIDIAGTPVTIALAGGAAAEIQAVAVSDDAPDEIVLKAAVENVMLDALEIRRIYRAVKAGEEPS